MLGEASVFAFVAEAEAGGGAGELDVRDREAEGVGEGPRDEAAPGFADLVALGGDHLQRQATRPPKIDEL